MSKIQFNELNSTSLEVLNSQEASEVAGGFSINRNLFSFNDNRTQFNGLVLSADTSVTSVQLDSSFAGGNGAGIGAGAGISINQTNQ